VSCIKPVKTGQKDKVFDFWMENTSGLGAEINNDPGRWGRLFALPSLPPLSGTQDKPRSWLGITMKLDESVVAGKPASPAIEALRVFPQSAAERAGLQNGDRIIALDNEKLIPGEENSVLAHFAKTIGGKTPGDKTLITVRRGETTQDLTAILSPRPKAELALKPHPDLDNRADQYPDSLIHFALKKEGLMDEYAKVTAEIREKSAEMMSPLVKGVDYNPFRLQEVNYVLSRPLDLPAVAHSIAEALHSSFNKDRHNLTALIRSGMEDLDLIYTPAIMKDNKPADLAEYVEQVVNAIVRADQVRSEILSVLTPEEIEILTAGAEAILKEDPSAVKKEKSEEEKQNVEKSQELFFNTALKLDLAGLLSAGALVAQALDVDTLVELKNKDPQLARYPNGWIVRQEENLTVLQTPAGKVLVGGKGNNVYTEDAALIVDLGGDDVYLNHAGGSSAQFPFAVVIDLSGNDLYSSSEDFAQGAGLLGGGFLVDLEGNDRYFARNYAQGAGVFGVGLLVDLSGNDEYKATAAVQGAGAFGIGLLAENGGNDRYFADRFAQGFGYIKGFGAVVEVSGNDNYFAGGTYADDRQANKAYQSMSQGFGFGMRPYESLIGASGGIGVIAEAEGNDTYVGDYFAQGASYWFALGILADRKGHDKYVSGRYSQGAGIHLSAGILMDGEGDDIYLSYFGVSQGCGHDLSIGILLDNGGDDRYISGVISQGAGNDNGIGILNDNGGNDEYYIKGLGQARGNFDRGRGMGSFGFHFDTGGGDDFYSPSGKNNRLIFRTDWGVFADTN
jgi:hypothetical protein